MLRARIRIPRRERVVADDEQRAAGPNGRSGAGEQRRCVEVERHVQVERGDEIERLARRPIAAGRRAPSGRVLRRPPVQREPLLRRERPPRVDAGDRPAVLGEPDRVRPVAATEVERMPGATWRIASTRAASGGRSSGRATARPDLVPEVLRVAHAGARVLGSRYGDGDAQGGARQGGGRRVRRRRFQRQQHGADPGDHGSGARDVVARDRAGLARRARLRRRPRSSTT